MSVIEAVPAPEPMATVVARRVRGLKGEMQLRQEDLAQALGVSRASMSERLRGETKFDINELPALASVLETSIEYLLGLTEIRGRGDASDMPTRGYVTNAAEAPLDELATVTHLPRRRAGLATPSGRPGVVLSGRFGQSA